MSEQMDLPTARGSLAAEWAGLSPAKRTRVASLFLRLRMVATEVRAANPSRMWGDIVELVEQHPLAPHGGGSLPDIARFCGDPEGLAFIDHMDAIAREAVVEHLLPEGSRVYGCIATLPRRRPMSSPVSLLKEGSEVVADRLDACFSDQALSGQGWDGLQQEWLSASRHISDAEDLHVWSGSEPREQEARRHLLAAAANLLSLSSHIEAMRRGER